MPLNLLVKTAILSNKEEVIMKRSSTQPAPAHAALRRRTVIDTARQLGLLGGKNGRIGGRVRSDLVEAAKAKSGIASDTELLEYALARVALEDDFSVKLLRRKGRVTKDIDLEF